MSDSNFAKAAIDAIPRPTKTYHSRTYDRITPSRTTFEAKAKTVLITAGATGIGFSISKAFAEAGVERVLVVSRRPEPQQRAKDELESTFPHTRVECIQCSITDFVHMAQILERAGPIDILVLNAATINPNKSPAEFERSVIESELNVNVTANFELVKNYLNLPPPASGQRTIINVGTGSSHSYVPGQMAYAASKAAFAQMMSFFADAYTPEKDGVRMSSFHPGIFYTENVAKKYPKDAVEWEDISLPGHFAVWLASPEADFLHGRFVWAQWDVDELMSKEVKGRSERDRFYLKIGLMQ